MRWLVCLIFGHADDFAGVDPWTLEDVFICSCCRRGRKEKHQYRR